MELLKGSRLEEVDGWYMQRTNNRIFPKNKKKHCVIFVCSSILYSPTELCSFNKQLLYKFGFACVARGNIKSWFYSLPAAVFQRNQEGNGNLNYIIEHRANVRFHGKSLPMVITSLLDDNNEKPGTRLVKLVGVTFYHHWSSTFQ